MTVMPGFAGQGLEKSVFSKVDQFLKYIQDRNIKIKLMADGSIDLETLDILIGKGVEIFVGGTSGLFTRDGFNNNLEILKERDKLLSKRT